MRQIGLDIHTNGSKLSPWHIVSYAWQALIRSKIVTLLDQWDGAHFALSQSVPPLSLIAKSTAQHHPRVATNGNA
jgi:hypothetical protein